jgi:gag-polypeptide of LTR copia-type
MSSRVSIEPLTKDNYNTWKIHAEALLVKTDGWQYVDGSKVKPTSVNAEIAVWEKGDRKAKSDLVLAISPSEMKVIKDCQTAKEVWAKLDAFYQSKGPARKATLLKRLTLSRMAEGGDIRQHLDNFFDTVDKLKGLKLEDDDWITIMLLYSLPPAFSLCNRIT